LSSDASFDFLEHCRTGAALATRDRRQATIDRIDAGRRQLHGSVEMEGACCWEADGRYAYAPCGAAGPLDLMPPSIGRRDPPRRAPLAEMLDPANRSACCD
jgi:hypothetical protein